MSWEQGNYEGHQQGGYGGYNDYGQQQQQGDYGSQQQGGYGGPQQPGYGAPPSHQGQFFQPEPGPQQQQQQGAWGAAGGTQQGGWGGPGGGQAAAPGVNFGGAQLPIDPLVTNMAMNYGANLIDQNKDEIKKKMEGYVDKYISVGQLKYYFAVDNSYVTRKLKLLLFPFLHSDWSIRYSHNEPVQPRLELNAADLYIPSMAFVTYILVVGYVLGMQDRFSPEVLATTASSALTALILEIIIIWVTTTVMSINTTLAKWDFLAFSMYKYVGMILCLLMGLISGTVYYASLAYSAAALALFLFRTLHLRVEPEVHGVENHGKRKLWLLFVLAGWQPIVMWWLTYSLVPARREIELPGPPM